jgi:hypothetical protein
MSQLLPTSPPVVSPAGADVAEAVAVGEVVSPGDAAADGAPGDAAVAGAPGDKVALGSCAGAAGLTGAAGGAPGLTAGGTPGGDVCGGAGDCANEVSASAREDRQAVSIVFIVQTGI